MHQHTHRWLHGEERQDLEQMILDDVADDAVCVKVAATPLGAKVLAEDYLKYGRMFGKIKSGEGDWHSCQTSEK